MGCSSSKIKEEKKQKPKPKPNLDKLKNNINKLINIRDILLIKENQENSKLNDLKFSSVNEFALNINKVYKNQKRPETSEEWTDDLFPPNQNSVMALDSSGNPKDPITSRYDSYLSDFSLKDKNIKWLRAKDIFPKGKFSLFEGEIEVDDIKQGSLGNCYFLSSIASMSLHPQLVCQIFRTLQPQDNGCYEICMKIEGEWQIVLVDDYFPVLSDGNFAFARPKNAELWVILLEKAWAKINGGYLNTISGFSTEVLNVLTNFPVITINTFSANTEQLWKDILKGVERGYVMSCLTQSDQNIHKVGLVPGHAFTLYDAKQGMINSGLIRLLRIRNPWGCYEFNGRWSDNSPEWNTESRKIFGTYKNGDDGCFWIQYEDYLKYFVATEICKTYNTLCSKSHKIEKDLNMPHLFELQVYDTNKITVSSIKSYWRTTRQIPENAELAMNILVSKIGNSNKSLEFIQAGNNYMHDTLLELKLEKGKYLISIHANYEASGFDQERPFSLEVIADDYFNLIYKGVDKDYGALTFIITQAYMEIEKDSDPIVPIERLGIFKQTNYFCVFFWNRTSEDKKSIVTLDDESSMKVLNKYSEFNLAKDLAHTVIMIPIQNYYDTCSVSYSTDPIESSTNIHFSDYSNLITPTESRTPPSKEFFDYIYLRNDVSPSQFCETINNKKMAESHFESVYPHLMKSIKELPQYQVDKEVIFKDKYFFANGGFYFGEWDFETEKQFYGRGYTLYPSGQVHVGYYKDDKFHGPGVLHYNDEDKIELHINYVNGKEDGEGFQVYKGEKVKLKYIDGEFQEWI